MNFKSNIVICALLNIIFLCILPSISCAQSNLDSLLSQEVSKTEITRKNTNEILGTLASIYNIPIATEVADVDINNSTEMQKLVVENNTVKYVLDAIIKVNPNYEWIEEDGLIRVRYKNRVTSDPLLDVLINEIEVDEKSSVEIKQIIADTPEVRKYLSEMKLEVRSPNSFLGPKSLYPKIKLKLRNYTVREILDYLIKTEKFKFWSVSRWGGENKYIRIVLW